MKINIMKIDIIKIYKIKQKITKNKQILTYCVN